MQRFHKVRRRRAGTARFGLARATDFRTPPHMRTSQHLPSAAACGAVLVALWPAWGRPWGGQLVRTDGPEAVVGCLALVLAALVWVHAAALLHASPRSPWRATGPALLLFIVMGCAAATHGAFDQTVVAATPAFGLLLGALGVASLGSSRSPPRAWAWPALAACGLLAILAHVDWPGGLDATYHGHTRLTGFLDHPNDLAALLASILTLAFCLSLPHPEHGRALRRVAVVVAAVAAVALARTFSRGGALAALVGCGICLAHLGRSVASSRACSGARWSLLPVAGAACVAVVLVWTAADTTWPPLRRALSFANPDDFSWTNRVRTLEAAGQAILLAPWAGWGGGWGASALAWVAGPEVAVLDGVRLNGWITCAGEWGLPSAILLVGVLALAGWRAWQSHSLVACTVAGLIGVHIVTGTLEGSWWRLPGLAGWAAVAVGLLASGPSRRDANIPAART